MSLKAGRVGVRPDQVNLDGTITQSASGAYTKSESDNKFLAKSDAASTYLSKSDAISSYQAKLTVINRTNDMELLDAGTYTSDTSKDLIQYGAVVQCFIDFSVNADVASWSNLLTLPDDITSGVTFSVTVEDVTAAIAFSGSGIITSNHKMQMNKNLISGHRYQIGFMFIINAF